MTPASPEPPRPADEQYVVFLEPGPGRPLARDVSPYSVEGCLAGVDAFAAGAARTHGWRRALARLVAVAILIPLLVPCWHGLVELVDLLLG